MIRATTGRLLRAALVALVLLAGAHAHAQRSRIDLRVVPDAQGCMTDASLRARVQRFLSPSAEPAKVRIAVDAGQMPLRFSLERGGRTVAERRFDVLPTACNDRLDAVALAIALAVERATNPVSTATDADDAADDTAAAAPTAAATTATADQTAAVAPKAGAPAAAEPPASRPGDRAKSPPPAADDTGSSTDLQVRVSAGGGGLFEVGPEPAVAAVAGVDLDFAPQLGLRLGALYGVAEPVELARGSGNGGSATGRVLAGRALGCVQTFAGDFALEGCGGVVGGALFASARGLTSRKNVALGWLAGGARAALRFPATTLFSLRLSLDGQLNAVRPRLVVQSQPDPPSPAQVVDHQEPSLFGAAISLELLLALR